MELKDRIRIDLFPDGEMPGFILPDYDARSVRVKSFEHIDVYRIDLITFVLTKAIAGRREDYRDIEKIVREKSSVPREKLIEMFQQLRLSKEKEDEIKKKFWAFVDEFYK